MNLKNIFSFVLFVFCAAFLLSVDVSAQETKTVVRRTSTFRGDSYAYKLTEQDFINTPSWKPEEGEPPISVNSALKVARENLPRFVKSAELWKMRMITLQSMGDEKWYYRVHFFCFGAACREIQDRSFTAIVKMDGSIVEPKKVTIED